MAATHSQLWAPSLIEGKEEYFATVLPLLRWLHHGQKEIQEGDFGVVGRPRGRFRGEGITGSPSACGHIATPFAAIAWTHDIPVKSNSMHEQVLAARFKSYLLGEHCTSYLTPSRYQLIVVSKIGLLSCHALTCLVLWVLLSHDTLAFFPAPCISSSLSYIESPSLMLGWVLIYTSQFYY
ncbi:uncharacterized protein G2W53_018126 [Senna tora]|uniref:Uncharacterized protein n=1 Tax=Senna tora TaxID=362788 RepID=A0A834TT35_9FABA|nr:uncharacterized protein G2W53_018126 [Senna tora]